MPMPTTAKWPKPRSEDEFEEMCIDAMRIRWKDPHATRNGRRGQRQDGVDIVGHPSWLKGATAGAQCKNTDALTLKEIVAEATKANSFKGGLGEFLILTSGDRDATLQGEVRQHFKANPAPFDVELLFWPDITGDIALDDTLVAKHWKGFGAPNRQADGWPDAPRSLDRDHVRPEETVEYHCELAVRTPAFADVAAAELAGEVQTVSRERASSAGIEIAVMVNKAPIRESGSIRWREHRRECTNVIQKWELEIAEDGCLAFRWSRFTDPANFPQPMLDILPFFDGVIAPLRLHRLAIERIITRSGVSLPDKLAVRLACNASASPMLLRDEMGATLPGVGFSMPEAPQRWAATLENKWDSSSRRIVIRILDRALSNFTASPRFPSGGGPSFVKANEEFVTKVGGTDL